MSYSRNAKRIPLSHKSFITQGSVADLTSLRAWCPIPRQASSCFPTEPSDGNHQTTVAHSYAREVAETPYTVRTDSNGCPHFATSGRHTAAKNGFFSTYHKMGTRGCPMRCSYHYSPPRRAAAHPLSQRSVVAERHAQRTRRRSWPLFLWRGRILSPRATTSIKVWRWVQWGPMDSVSSTGFHEAVQVCRRGIGNDFGV